MKRITKQGMSRRTLNLNSVSTAAEKLIKYAVMPGVQLVLALGWLLLLGGMVAFTSGAVLARMAAMNSHGFTMGSGPSPAAQTTANMPQARLTTYYNRVFMQWLYQLLNKILLYTHMDLPEKSGQTFRNFMSIPLGADTQQQTEGTLNSPESIAVNFRDIIMGQWANFNNISDLAFMTSISNDLEENRRIMAYQLALTIDDLSMYMLDYLRTFDTRTCNQDSLNSPYPFSKSIIEQMPASLSGATVPPMKSGEYNGSIHPFFVGDMQLDNSNNSIVDIWKHTDAGQLKLEALTDADEGQGATRILDLFGARWRQSTNQTQYAAWQGSASTGVSTYLAGLHAGIFVNFPNKRHTKIDPRWQNMNLWAGEYTAKTAFDPNGLIYGGTGYNCVLGLGLPPDPASTSRARIAVAVPQTT